VLTQLSTLITLGVTSPQDRDAIKAWVDGNADREKARDVYDSLAHLKVGEGWIWAPDLGLLKRVTFPPIATLDTSKTPKAGDVAIASPVLAAADICELKAKLVQFETGHSAGNRAERPRRSRAQNSPAPKKRALPPARKRPPARDPVAAAILKARTRAGLTQEELAKRLHTDQGNIARLERSRSQATVRTLRRLAEATGHELVINFRRPAKKRKEA
jgi:uncharacterized protein